MKISDLTAPPIHWNSESVMNAFFHMFLHCNMWIKLKDGQILEGKFFAISNRDSKNRWAFKLSMGERALRARADEIAELKIKDPVSDITKSLLTELKYGTSDINRRDAYAMRALAERFLPKDADLHRVISAIIHSAKA